MNEILKALQNRKMEVELKSEVVELGATQDLEQAIKKLDNIRVGSKGNFMDSNRVAKQLKPLLQERKEHLESISKTKSFVDKANADIKKAFNTLSKQASELGISPTKLPVYKIYETRTSLLKEIEKFDSDSKKLLGTI